MIIVKFSGNNPPFYDIFLKDENGTSYTLGYRVYTKPPYMHKKIERTNRIAPEELERQLKFTHTYQQEIIRDIFSLNI